MPREERSLIDQLEELRQDLDRVREAHALLTIELKEFGRTLGLIRIAATDEAVKDEVDDAS
jgi:hypothetical protein